MSERCSLVLAGHGYPRRPQARHPAQDHAERLQRVGPFDDVSAGLLHGSPGLTAQLQSLDGPAVVVPLFVSDGYFAGEVIPDLIASHCSATTTYTPPVGTHRDLTDVIWQRAISAVDGPPGGVELAAVGHGSTRDSANRETVEAHARRLRDRDRFDAVRSYFLEESPGIERLSEDALRSEVVAVPVFAADGHHVSEEIPELLGIPAADSESDGVSITYTEPVGTDPRVADIAVERAMEALDSGKHRAAQHGSEVSCCE